VNVLTGVFRLVAASRFGLTSGRCRQEQPIGNVEATALLPIECTSALGTCAGIQPIP